MYVNSPTRPVNDTRYKRIRASMQSRMATVKTHRHHAVSLCNDILRYTMINSTFWAGCAIGGVNLFVQISEWSRQERYLNRLWANRPTYSHNPNLLQTLAWIKNYGISGRYIDSALEALCSTKLNTRRKVYI
jgi:hypothetical protein